MKGGSEVANRELYDSIVAVAGINSHPFGSWVDEGNLKRMWLRDFFSKDFPSCRTMIYGYDANLRSQSVYKILDLRNDFLAAISQARHSEEVCALYI